MLHVVCLNVGNYQGRGEQYVNTLYDMVTRNLPEGMLGDFSVFTDNGSEKLAPGIKVRPVMGPAHLKGWWNKLTLFQAGLFPKGERIVYFDLDTVITGPLDDIVSYAGDFAILRDFYRPNGLQASIMAWPAGEHDDIWQAFEAQGYPQHDPLGDQGFIENHVRNPEIWQTLFPGKFFSYKRDGRFGIPIGNSVCVFHGRPRPHEVVDGWVPKVWKVGGATSAQLELIGNVDQLAIRSNIVRSENIPDATWLKPIKMHDKVAVICAGGPSLTDEILSVYAQARSGSHVFACNGVPAKLKANGIKTDFHVILDARPQNAAFARDQSETTICLYSSQCDKSVHDHAGDNLVLWHPAFDGVVDIVGADKARAYIGGGTTCGMKAAVIAWTLGYRTIHLYGFDSCYRGSEHHAYSQPLNDGEQILDVEFNGQTYRCAPWMVQQAEDFETFGPQLIDHGVELHIHGAGLIPDIAKNFAKGVFRPESADFRALAILERLQSFSEPKVAEIGVFAGDLSRRLLARRPDLDLIMVDSWSGAPRDAYVQSQDYHTTLSQEAQDRFFRLASDVTHMFKDRRTILRMDSQDAARAIADASLDMAFLDADHSYEGCKADISAYYAKVRPGGFIAGHDYANDDWKFGPMVKRAVDEFVEEKGLMLELGENFTWFARKPTQRGSLNVQ